MKHRKSLCYTPRVYFQQDGMLWQCNCGKVYRFNKRLSIRGGMNRYWEYVFTKELT